MVVLWVTSGSDSEAPDSTTLLWYPASAYLNHLWQPLNKSVHVYTWQRFGQPALCWEPLVARQMNMCGISLDVNCESVPVCRSQDLFRTAMGNLMLKRIHWQHDSSQHWISACINARRCSTPYWHWTHNVSVLPTPSIVSENVNTCNTTYFSTCAVSFHFHHSESLTYFVSVQVHSKPYVNCSTRTCIIMHWAQGLKLWREL